MIICIVLIIVFIFNSYFLNKNIKLKNEYKKENLDLREKLNSIKNELFNSEINYNKKLQTLKNQYQNDLYKYFNKGFNKSQEELKNIEENLKYLGKNIYFYEIKKISQELRTDIIKNIKITKISIDINNIIRIYSNYNEYNLNEIEISENLKELELKLKNQIKEVYNIK